MQTLPILLLCLLPLAVALLARDQQAIAPGGDAPENKSSRPRPLPVLSPRTVAHMDIAYVQPADAQQMLDIYAPRQVANAPVVLYIHGGEWAKRDKWEVAFKPAFLNDNGIILASANYRLSGSARHPAQVNDIAAAVRWLTDHIAEYGGDPRQIILMGHSAGCHMVSLVGLDPRPLAAVGLQPGDLLGVVNWSGGAYDLVQKVADGGMYAGYIHQNFGDQQSVWFDASPINHIGDARPMPAFLFVNGEDDKPGSLAINPEMVRRIEAAGGYARYALIPGKNHFHCDYDFGKPGDDSGEILLRFIQNLPKGNS